MAYGAKDFKGTFITPFPALKKKAANIRAFVFDWDGVFNNGEKSGESGSHFSEVDSMGTNLLRFSHHLRSKENPVSALISGEKNPTALHFSQRENFHYSFYKIPHKIKALEILCEKEKLKPSEIAFFFDDVLDLSVAKVAGVRILVNQKANPLFLKHCIKNKLADYVTSVPGGQHAVREGSEVIMALNGNFDECIRHRTDYSEDYKAYISVRRTVNTHFFTNDTQGIHPVSA